MMGRLWTDEEWRLVNVVDVFHQKLGIMKKVEANFLKLKGTLVRHISESGMILPPGTDVEKGQIARGENYKGFPYVSLDMPQKFSKEEMFTFRALFWWGHHLVFSLILKGETLPEWGKNLAGQTTSDRMKYVYLSLAPKPWEWELNETNFKYVSEMTPSEIERTVLHLKYIKLCCFFPLSDISNRDLNWVSEGRRVFQDLVETTKYY